jgi:uncharacterized protein YybS (DUF2232 family)
VLHHKIFGRHVFAFLFLLTQLLSHRVITLIPTIFLIFVTVESGLTSLLGFAVIVGLPLALPLMLKFILLSFGESLVSLGLIVPWILSGSVLGS